MANDEIPFYEKERIENEEILNSLTEDLKEDITSKDVGLIVDYTWRYINSSRFDDISYFTEKLIYYVDNEAGIDGHRYDFDLIEEVALQYCKKHNINIEGKLK